MPKISYRLYAVNNPFAFSIWVRKCNCQFSNVPLPSKLHDDSIVRGDDKTCGGFEEAVRPSASRFAAL